MAGMYPQRSGATVARPGLVIHPPPCNRDDTEAPAGWRGKKEAGLGAPDQDARMELKCLTEVRVGSTNRIGCC